GPSEDPLAARLLEHAELHEGAFQPQPRLLLEFAYFRGERIFALIEQALRDRPGAVVLLGPIRPAGMNEQQIDGFPAAAKQENPGALLRHVWSRLALRAFGCNVVCPPRRL